MSTVPKQENDILTQLEGSIGKAVQFLTEHQLPNGEFMTYFSPDNAMQEWCVPESNTFIPAFIGNCLIPLEQQYPQITTALDRTTGFLQYQTMRGGVWQFFSKWHPRFKYLAPDIDDTVTILSFLQKRKLLNSDNPAILLANRNRQGLFYTWFTIHPTFLKFPRAYWRLILRELKAPVGTLLYWIKGDLNRNDVDAIVNANVIYYLGFTPVTRPIVSYLVTLIKEGQEAGSDKWYLNPLAYYYFFTRLYTLPDIPEALRSLKPVLCKKVLQAMHDSSQFPGCDMEIALVLSTLIHIEYEDLDFLGSLASQLMTRQQQTGNWRRYILSSHPKQTIGWGSEETTTALAIEALNQFRTRLQRTFQENSEAD